MAEQRKDSVEALASQVAASALAATTQQETISSKVLSAATAKDDDADDASEQHQFNWRFHCKYFSMFLHVLPQRMQTYDSNRTMIVYFGLAGLDLLGQTGLLSDNAKQNTADWIYSMQIPPDSEGSEDNTHALGFSGGCRLPSAFNPTCEAEAWIPGESSHITMTFCALCSLAILRAPLDRVNRSGIVRALAACQTENGTFQSVATGGESDMRFLYCACCISTMLNDWSGVDKDRAVDFIVNSLTYEGAFAQNPYQEAHGGSTFCAVAALSLMGRLDALSSDQREELVAWLLRRQHTGFNGRPHKLVDTCYSFWIGGALRILGVSDLVDLGKLRGYLTTTEQSSGGFSKHSDGHADPVHSYLGLAGLALMNEPGTQPINPELNMSQDSVDYICKYFADQKS
eukprot:m.363261 g.363261  ORF g.363261 m.363261 type:complete len:401 (-) comp21840_c0_seq1:228-1430(-)